MSLSTDADRWLSVEEIAHHIGVSKESIYRWAEKRKMPAHKVGRQWKFKTAEVDSWILAGNATEEKLNSEGHNEI